MSNHYQFMYVSRLAEGVPSSEIANIVRTCRVNNPAVAVSGILLFDGASFCQYIEGPESVGRNMAATILRDPRHTQITTVFEAVEPSEAGAAERRFERWFVGFLSNDGHNSPLDHIATLQGEAAVAALLQIYRDRDMLGFNVV